MDVVAVEPYGTFNVNVNHHVGGPTPCVSAALCRVDAQSPPVHLRPIPLPSTSVTASLRTLPTMPVSRLPSRRLLANFVARRSATACAWSVFGAACRWPQYHPPTSGPQLSRSFPSGMDHPLQFRRYVSQGASQDKKHSGAVPRNVPSSRGSPGPSRGDQRHRIRDAVLTSVCSIAVLFAGGGIYMYWYKEHVLWKIRKAFSSGYDPSLDLAKHVTPEPWTHHFRRTEQDHIDRIVQGDEAGHYFILLGPKGTGKTTMVLDAMRASQGEGTAMCDAHPDPEVFRLRLGKAFNYEYNEDSQTGLFQRRDPRDGSSAFDIEGALNKLESVALRYSKANGKPLVLVINNVHFFNHDDSGRNILLQFQQRAEAWAASGILTMVFSTDDFWPWFVMRQNGSRMQVVSVHDLSWKESVATAKSMLKNANRSHASDETFEEVVNLVGGRLTYMGRVTKAADMLKYARHLLTVEKAWLLSQIGLIPDCDDDVMDEQKWSSCSWLLLREFVKRRQEDVIRVKEKIERGEAKLEDLHNLQLPKISYYEARQIMTRADFLEELDRKNIIAIDINYDLTPDSMLILHAAEEVCVEKGFNELLDAVRDKMRVSQHAQELTLKEVDKGVRIDLEVEKRGA